MRGLTGGRDGGRRTASGTAMAGLAVLGVFAAGCSTGGTGLRDDGPATGEAGRATGSATPSAPASPGPVSPGAAAGAKRPDPLKLLRKDPEVDPEIKAALKPCVEGGPYPVDTAFGHLTGGTAPDVVVNVATCDDSIALASYVYRLEGSGYRNVFIREEPAVFSAIDRGDLVVTQQIYEKDDPTATTAEEVLTYRWTAGTDGGGRFVETHWTRTQYRSLPAEDGEAYSPTFEGDTEPEAEPGGGRGGVSGGIRSGSLPSGPASGSASGTTGSAARGASGSVSGTASGGGLAVAVDRFYAVPSPVLPAALAVPPGTGARRES
ncbi:hypothetical protein ABZ714_13495 [Streptomyces sp. NPDC006798]|uniref:hypothetical protein n=1 Tax=Streptomyces sp. NPDC006798 TaxID=3155462 RepID=UPI0034018DED